MKLVSEARSLGSFFGFLAMANLPVVAPKEEREN